MNHCKITHNNGALEFFFRVPSFAVRNELRKLEKAYSDIIEIIDRKMNLSELDLSDLTPDAYKKVNEDGNFANILDLALTLLPKNPNIMKILMGSDLTSEQRERKDLFYLEAFNLAIDKDKMPDEMKIEFSKPAIENQLLTAFDMGEVAVGVSFFRGLCK